MPGFRARSEGVRRARLGSVLAIGYLAVFVAVQDWGKLLGDSAAVSAMLDRLLHHGHVLQCGPRSWRTKTNSHGENQSQRQMQ
jgi:hypothetical protein